MSVGLLATHLRAHPRSAAGYNPRPYQESWHNRLCLQGNATTAINQDSYERLIAFTTGATVDAAMGEVGVAAFTALPLLHEQPPRCPPLPCR